MADEPALFRVLLEVADLRKAGDFYDRLLGFAGRDVGGSRRYYECASVIVGIVDAGAGGEAPVSAPQYLYFAVSNLEEVHARAKALDCLYEGDVHGDPGGEIGVRPWRERSFYAVDPYGNGLCFVDETTLFTGTQS